MNRKIRVIAAVLFVLMTAGAYAQNVSLRGGYYQTQGFADHIFIAPNSADSGQGKTPENAFKAQRGFYGVMAWAGMPEPDNLLFTATGNIVGDEFRINIERRHKANMTTHGLSIPRGTLAIWSIADNETFFDESGQRWIWRRQK